VLVDTPSWPSWGGLVTSAQGQLSPGAQWSLTLRGHGGGPERLMHPRLIAVQPPRRVVFETVLGARWLVRLVHAFDLDPVGPSECLLRQSFEATGAAVPLLWRPLRAGMTQFEELGHDLARALGGNGTQPA